jgi:type II secretory pathway component PulF
MPLIVTPRQLMQRAELYHQVAQLANAGVGLLQTLEALRRSPPAHAFRAPLARLRDRIEQGATFADALRSTGRWLPSFDLALLEAGEKSGRLPGCFKLLGDYYAERARLLREMIANLLYPVFLIHAAVFILPFPGLFLSGDVFAYLSQTLGVLLPLYLVVLLLILAAQGRHGERWRAFIEAALRPIPVLGSARADLALARLTIALEALVNAGVSIIAAWEMAAAASGSPRLRRVVNGWRPQLELGQTPAELVTASGAFPEIFANLYHTGEISGQVDDTLRRLHVLYQESASRKLRLLAEWLPRLVYLGIVIVIAVKVVSFWMGHWARYNNALDGLPL